MRILVTGCYGYIGSVLVPRLVVQGHEVLGLDSGLFKACTYGEPAADVACVAADVRDVTRDDLVGIDAIIHLAALSNDPLGNLDRELTLEINHLATVRLAELAKEAGVKQFLFSSSCSTYGSAGDAMLDEHTQFAPVTPYAESKVLSERDLAPLADERFNITYLRNATAYGLSPRLRLDLVVNDFVATAVATGRIVVKSDGTPWRPVVHVEDICRAFEAILVAPRAAVQNRAFNIGRTDENYRVSELAEIVRRTVPGCTVEYATGGGPDKRCYRVDCSRVERELPGFHPQWDVPRGVRQLYDAFRTLGMTDSDLDGPRYFRLRTLKAHLDAGRLQHDLHWTSEPASLRQIPASALP